VSRRPCAALAVSRVHPGLKVAGEQHQVEQAVADALRLRAISLDAVKMLQGPSQAEEFERDMEMARAIMKKRRNVFRKLSKL
jgi:hypothetical protein